MDEMKLLIDRHIDGERQGPGSRDETLTAVALAGLNPKKALRVADIGCGTGSSTLVLAEALNCEVTGIDLISEFLEKLSSTAIELGLNARITSRVCSMESLPFRQEELDVIWSEVAIYNIGFQKGIQQWSSFLKRGGVLAVSEITWLTRERPREIQDYWEKEYPEIALPSEKIAVLEQSGFKLLGYFPLKSTSWTEIYYLPLEARSDGFLKKHPGSREAQILIENDRKEAALFEKYKDYYSYGFYIAKKL